MQLIKKSLNYKLLLVLTMLLFITGCDNPDHTALKHVYRLLESNDSEVNSELVTFLGYVGTTLQRVNSSTCTIEEKDNYGRYILSCSINYDILAGTRINPTTESRTGSVYVGYLNTGGKNFSYKIGATHYSNGSGLKTMKNKICWNSSSKSMDCTINDNYEQNDNVKKEKADTTSDNESTNYTGEDYLNNNKITVNDYLNMYSSNKYAIILLGRETCNYCVEAKSILNKIMSEYNVTIYYLNLDNFSNEDFEAFLSVGEKRKEIVVPTLEVVGNNSVKDELTELKSSGEYISFLKENNFIN